MEQTACVLPGADEDLYTMIKQLCAKYMSKLSLLLNGFGSQGKEKCKDYHE